MTNEAMVALDLKHIWHPCTQMKDHESLPLIPIQSAHGVYIKDYENNAYIDAISSWWVNIFGHTNPYINDKIKEQLDTLEHVIFAGFTHPQIVRLSERLVKLTPQGLEKCFYADNGSSAVEVALKMSFQYFKNKNINKTLFLSLENSYHGETIGALSVGDVGLYKDTYQEILIKSIQTPVPHDMSLEAAVEAAEALRHLLEDRGDEICAFIVEPLVQCAGYMHMYHPYYLTLARALCNTFNVHLIADEIAVGFGRTGTMFACEQAHITPDYMTLSKGLTGGYLPLSVVLTTDEIYSAFYCDYVDMKAFLHSHSYTGNALACAAANATLDIFEKENTIEKNQEIIAYIDAKLQRFSELENVVSIRQTGMIAVVELKEYDWKQRVNLKIFQYALSKNVFIRPLGHVLYFMPPYIITHEEIDTMMDVAYDAIESLD